VALAVTGTLILSACGGGSGGNETNGQQGANGQPAAGSGGSAGSGSAAGNGGGGNAKVATIESTFPTPKPLPNSPPGAKKAIEAGRRACKGKTPEQVRDEFMSEAEASGLLNAGQKTMIANIAHYEKQAATSADFVAGQLAAGVYEATLPEELRIAGYQGCVYELAQQLLKEIAQ
jgi:hypothetical protein